VSLQVQNLDIAIAIEEDIAREGTDMVINQVIDDPVIEVDINPVINDPVIEVVINPVINDPVIEVVINKEGSVTKDNDTADEVR
jgi:hypothetical protein